MVSKYYNYKDYNKMNIAQQDSILLQTAMIDENLPGLPRSIPFDDITTELSLEWQNAITQNAKYKNGILKADKNASIIIPIKNK